VTKAVSGATKRSTDAGHDAPAALAPLLACASCGRQDAVLSLRAESFVCGECKTRFPTFKSGNAQIPWLFRDPEAVLLEWRSRFNSFLHVNSSRQARLKRTLQDTLRSKAAGERLTRLLHALDAQKKEVVNLLAPLNLGAPRADSKLDRSGLLHRKLPRQHGLLSYSNNVFRDWSWENGENEKRFECVGRTLQAARFKAGRMLTLGAGACRLSYDLHRHYRPELSVALDWNPLLIFIAARVIHGDTVAFHEFPVAPLDKASVAVARTCAAPEPIRADGAFMFVLADAMDSPFKADSFDTVVTPWVIDSIPQDFVDFVRVVNRNLKIGGVWLNTGSLAFFHRNEAWCYSEEEVLKLVTANGFEVMTAERVDIPYLQSPVSAHGRVERAFSFSARKIAAAESPKLPRYLPSWLLEPDRVVPDLDEFVAAAAHQLVKAYVLAAIDGKRTVDEIAWLIARRYELQHSEAKGAVQRILIELYESSSIPKDDASAELE
jgi:hypothetical protein